MTEERPQGRAANSSAVGDEPMMVRVLGPVDIVVPRGVITIGSRLERKLFAALALSANQVISSGRLAQILWGEDPPVSRDNTLQTYVSRLRALLGHHRICSENGGYVLRVAPGELDALGFEVLGAETAAARSDPARCLALCEEALALWRGAPYGAFAAEDPFRLEVIRLEGMRMFLIELRIECEIVLGNEALVVGALEALVEEYPYRERIWHLLIVALSLCGRRVEALAACTRLRELLATVGLEPAMQIRALEGEILVEDPQVRPRLRSLLRESARAHSREDR